jgi:regulator of sigma E protease
VALALTIIGFMALIVLHELGHFVVAKAVGMRVERFSLFFPPRLAGIKRGETDYAIGAIPAGGYVKITGMSPMELQQVDLRVSDRAYYMQAPWKRIVVILAGPGVNILIAFLLFWAVLLSGSLHGATALYNLDESVTTLRPTSHIAGVAKGGPAVRAGVQRGDRIVAVDGRPAGGIAAQRAIVADRCAGTLVAGCQGAAPIRLTVLRDKRRVELSIVPRYEPAARRMLIGVSFGDVAKSFGPLSAAGAAIAEMWHVTGGALTHYVKALTQPKARHELHSIVGITEVGQETFAAGAGYAFVFLGFLSLVLAIVNLFPFLPLDGGHVLWSLGEKLRGRRISLMAMYRYSSVGIVLMLFLFVNGVGNDLSHLTG